MIDRISDTIVAISSAAGAGSRGIVRLSGPRAVELAASGFRPDTTGDLHRAAGRTRTRGRYALGASAFVPACVQVFRKPQSYTRQDVVEIHTIGSNPILGRIVEILLKGGARAAEPGEFTARAFFAGAMDLTEVEGVAALIRARSDSQVRAAERLLHGDLSRRLQAIRDALAAMLALIEADIDFAEEPIELIAPSDARRRLADVREQIADLLVRADASHRFDSLPTVLLTGPPNAGKSTLLNRLTGLQRAICSPLAGTTRDVLTAPMRLDRGDVLLIDAAGVGHVCTDIDRSAAEALDRAWAGADTVLLVLDASTTVSQQVLDHMADVPHRPSLIVANKCDLAPDQNNFEKFFALQRMLGCPLIDVCATLGTGCDKLKSWLSERIFSGAPSAAQGMVLLNHRHRQSIHRCLESIDRVLEMLGGIQSLDRRADVVAFELREALESLESLTGRTTSEEILGRIFNQFCVGK